MCHVMTKYLQTCEIFEYFLMKSNEVKYSAKTSNQLKICFARS